MHCLLLLFNAVWGCQLRLECIVVKFSSVQLMVQTKKLLKNLGPNFGPFRQNILFKKRDQTMEGERRSFGNPNCSFASISLCLEREEEVPAMALTFFWCNSQLKAFIFAIFFSFPLPLTLPTFASSSFPPPFFPSSPSPPSFFPSFLERAGAKPFNFIFPFSLYSGFHEICGRHHWAHLLKI